jgi:hypothetical protein
MPDIIGIARSSVKYTTGSKLAENGGFNEDDIHVVLLVAHPALARASINVAVARVQIAPKILKVF